MLSFKQRPTSTPPPSYANFIYNINPLLNHQNSPTPASLQTPGPPIIIPENSNPYFKPAYYKGIHSRKQACQFAFESCVFTLPLYLWLLVTIVTFSHPNVPLNISIFMVCIFAGFLCILYWPFLLCFNKLSCLICQLTCCRSYLRQYFTWESTSLSSTSNNLPNQKQVSSHLNNQNPYQSTSPISSTDTSILPPKCLPQTACCFRQQYKIVESLVSFWALPFATLPSLSIHSHPLNRSSTYVEPNDNLNHNNNINTSYDNEIDMYNVPTFSTRKKNTTNKSSTKIDANNFNHLNNHINIDTATSLSTRTNINSAQDTFDDVSNSYYNNIDPSSSASISTPSLLSPLQQSHLYNDIHNITLASGTQQCVSWIHSHQQQQVRYVIRLETFRKLTQFVNPPDSTHNVPYFANVPDIDTSTHHSLNSTQFTNPSASSPPQRVWNSPQVQHQQPLSRGGVAQQRGRRVLQFGARFGYDENENQETNHINAETTSSNTHPTELLQSPPPIAPQPTSTINTTTTNPLEHYPLPLSSFNMNANSPSLPIDDDYINPGSDYNDSFVMLMHIEDFELSLFNAHNHRYSTENTHYSSPDAALYDIGLGTTTKDFTRGIQPDAFVRMIEKYCQQRIASVGIKDHLRVIIPTHSIPQFGITPGHTFGDEHENGKPIGMDSIPSPTIPTTTTTTTTATTLTPNYCSQNQNMLDLSNYGEIENGLNELMTFIGETYAHQFDPHAQIPTHRMVNYQRSIQYQLEIDRRIEEEQQRQQEHGNNDEMNENVSHNEVIQQEQGNYDEMNQNLAQNEIRAHPQSSIQLPSSLIPPRMIDDPSYGWRVTGYWYFSGECDESVKNGGLGYINNLPQYLKHHKQTYTPLYLQHTHSHSYNEPFQASQLTTDINRSIITTNVNASTPSFQPYQPIYLSQPNICLGDFDIQSHSSSSSSSSHFQHCSTSTTPLTPTSASSTTPITIVDRNVPLTSTNTTLFEQSTPLTLNPTRGETDTFGSCRGNFLNNKSLVQSPFQQSIIRLYDANNAYQQLYQHYHTLHSHHSNTSSLSAQSSIYYHNELPHNPNQEQDRNTIASTSNNANNNVNTNFNNNNTNTNTNNNSNSNINNDEISLTISPPSFQHNLATRLLPDLFHQFRFPSLSFPIWFYTISFVCPFFYFLGSVFGCFCCLHYCFHRITRYYVYPNYLTVHSTHSLIQLKELVSGDRIPHRTVYRNIGMLGPINTRNSPLNMNSTE